MTFFCPNCGNLLIAEEGTTIYFKCCSCPYKFVFNKKVQDETKLKRKEVDAVIGEDAFKNAPKAESLLFISFIIKILISVRHM